MQLKTFALQEHVDLLEAEMFEYVNVVEDVMGMHELEVERAVGENLNVDVREKVGQKVEVDVQEVRVVIAKIFVVSKVVAVEVTFVFAVVVVAVKTVAAVKIAVFAVIAVLATKVEKTHCLTYYADVKQIQMMKEQNLVIFLMPEIKVLILVYFHNILNFFFY